MPRYTNFEVNGILDTTQNVLDNLNTLATTVGCWITYDSLVGRWSTVINRPGDSEYSFDDTNIIGGVTVSGTGITELYNSVTVQFPNQDLQDHSDYIDYIIPIEDRNLNEPENNLLINLTTVNNAPQAQYIGISELKQARLDKVIQFKTDYSSIGLKAGTIIDVTQEQYGFENKLFRIVKITEDDADDGNIILEITALEYSDDIYSTNGLVRKERNKKTGVVPKSMNTILTNDDKFAIQSGLWKKFFEMPPVNILGGGYSNINFGYNISLPATSVYRATYHVFWGLQGLPQLDEQGNIMYDQFGNIIFVYAPETPLGVKRISRIFGTLNNQPIYATNQTSGSAGDEWEPSSNTHILDMYFQANQGDVLTLNLQVYTNWSKETYQHPTTMGFPAYVFTSPPTFVDRSAVSVLGSVEIASELQVV